MNTTTTALDMWQESVRTGRQKAAAALIAAAPALRVQDGWQGPQAGTASVALAGPLDGGQVVALVTCPMHAGILALGLSVAGAERLARAALSAEGIDYSSEAGTITELSVLAGHLGPGEHLTVSLPEPSDGRPCHTVKVYAHGVADVDLVQLRIPAAAEALTALTAAPTAA
ncbi:hypothetical protein ACGF12_22570 [Kitasatospora sp. NPDC048296]|uniref:hypothetical protein n=1 Tax=Kitasatospora sp. NPDC048296 TaxID=3364048 RepID=UPI00371519D1